MRSERRSPRPGDHVLVVVDHFAPSRGGTELLAGDLARSLMRLGRPVEVLCRPHHRRGADPDGIPVHEMQPAFGDRALAGLLADARFGAVIGISGPLGFPVLGLLRQPALLARLRSLVVPCVNEEFDGVVRASPGFLRDYARSLFRVDAVGYSSRDGWDAGCSTSSACRACTCRTPSRAWPRAARIRETLEVARSMPIILHVANFWPQKNHLAFLDQMRGLPGDWRLVCIGGPSADHPQLAREVAIAAARDPRVVLFGEATREEVAGAMAQADVLVLPSIAEATPLVLLEAMSHGLPWIVSDTCRSAADLAGGVDRIAHGLRGRARADARGSRRAQGARRRGAPRVPRGLLLGGRRAALPRGDRRPGRRRALARRLNARSSRRDLRPIGLSRCPLISFDAVRAPFHAEGAGR